MSAAGASETIVCATCGATPAPQDRDAALVTWTRGTEDGRSEWTCPACSREHLRSIEAKLQRQWW